MYALVASLYICFSDRLLEQLFTHDTLARITRFQTIKGICFVVITAVMLYLLIRRLLVRLSKSRRALEESEGRFRRMVEWSPNGIFVQCQEKFVYVNHALLHLLGAADPSQLLGQAVLDFIHPDFHAAVRERMRILRDQRRTVPLMEQQMRRLDGTHLWAEISGQPFDFDGEPGAQVIVRDISDRKRAEQEVRELTATLEKRVASRTAELQQANEDLRTFSYTISHDIRTPLRNMAGFAQRLLSLPSCAGDPAAQECARRLLAAAVRLDRLTQDLHEYNQIARQDIQLQRISLVLTVHDVVGQLQRITEFAEAQIEIREPMPWVLAHRPTLAMVIQNLLHNALKFVAAGTRPMITIRAHDNNGMARLIVEDNGLGMDPETAAKVFHHFERPQTCDDTRRGVGLAIVRRGVERMGGKVGVESAPGHGSRFWIELPKDPQSP